MPEASKHDRATTAIWEDGIQEWGFKAEECEEPNWEIANQVKQARLLRKCGAEGTCMQGHKLENVRATTGPEQTNNCDTCWRRMNSPEKLLRCEGCNFDVCLPCSGNKPNPILKGYLRQTKRYENRTLEPTRREPMAEGERKQLRLQGWLASL